MPIHTAQNLYHGVNAHLNSYLQNTAGEWESFHATHISLLALHLDEKLPVGYFARTEKSLQITQEWAEWTHRPRPDVTLFGHDHTHSTSSGGVAVAPTATSPVVETMDIPEDTFLNAVVIYRGDKDNPLGRPITRLELLSPTNKPPNKGYPAYRDKRNESLMSGLPLIEIDYLHQLESPVANLPSYPRHEAGAYPYTIVVNDPRPTLETGLTHVYGFRVDEPFPPFVIPLKDDEQIVFNLTAMYAELFGRTRFYQTVVDYEKLPLKYETYAPNDQVRIVERRHQIMHKHQSTSE